MSANYLKQLFELRDGGQCRVRNTCVCFHPLQPKILCINDTPEAWLRAVDGHTDANNEPLKKRLFFVHIDEPVIAPAAVAAHEDDLDAIVAKGKRRRIELQGDQASESDLTPTTAGSAYVEAISESEDGDEADDDDSASPYSSATSQLPPGASGPPGPDGKPLFTRLPELVAVYLVVATDILVRMGELPGEVHQHYLAALRSVQPAMADAYENTTHCSVSFLTDTTTFLTDTTTLKLMQAWLAGSGKLTEDALYNLIVGQTVLPSCRDLKHWAPSELMPRRRLRSLPIAFASYIRGART